MKYTAWHTVYKKQQETYSENINSLFGELMFNKEDIKKFQKQLYDINIKDDKDIKKLKDLRSKILVWYGAREILCKTEKEKIGVENGIITDSFLLLELSLYTVSINEIYKNLLIILENNGFDMNNNIIKALNIKDNNNISILRNTRNALAHNDYELIGGDSIKYKLTKEDNYNIRKIFDISHLTHNIYRFSVATIYHLLQKSDIIKK